MVAGHAGRIAVLTILAIASAPVVPASVASARSFGADPLDEARELHARGTARFETLDYEGAIELWTQAYAKVPEQEPYREIRNELVYNIATARERAFDVDGDATHLKRAKGLLERYLDEFKDVNRPSDENLEEAKRVEERIAVLDGKIAAVATVAAPAAVAAPPPREPSRTEKIKLLLNDDPGLRKRYRSGRGMVIGGSVSLGLSLIGVLAIGSGNIVTQAVGGSIGGALLVTGLVLVPIGAKRMKAAKREAAGRVAVLPGLDRHGGGVWLAGKF